MKIVNVLNAVLQAAATQCAACPEAPEVTVIPSPIFTGPTITLGIPRGRSDEQKRSIHGVAIPLSPVIGTTSGGRVTTVKPAGYQVWVGYYLATWDSYVSAPAVRGRFDSFSISTSVSPYSNLGLQDPLSPFFISPAVPLPPLVSPGQAHTCESTAFPVSASEACTFNAGFLFGGQNQGTALQDIDSSLAGATYNLPGRLLMGTANTGDANTWLNFVLDTASSPDSDNLFPSWGYFVVFDITPLCSSNPDLLLGPLQVGSCPPPSH